MAHTPQSPGDSVARSLYAYAVEANEDEWQTVVRGVVGLVDGGRERLRRQGINLISTLTLEVLMNYLMSSGKITEDQFRQSMEFLETHRHLEEEP